MAATALAAGRAAFTSKQMGMVITGDTMTRQALTSGPASIGRPSIHGICSSTGLWMSLAVLCLTTCLISSAQTVPSSNIGPAYQVDLRSVLKANAVPQIGTRETPWVPVITLAFLNNERLAATLVVPANVPPRLTARDRPDAASPFRLRGVVLDASTGRVLATPEWPSNSRAAGIVAANDRGLVIQIGVELTLLSHDLTPVEQTTLPSPSAIGGHPDGVDWGPTAASWSGKRVLLTAGPAWAARPWLWLDAEKLSVLKSWVDAATGAIAVSDDQIVLEPSSQHFGDPPSSLMAESPGGPWRAIPDTLRASRPQFVDQDLLCFNRDVPGTLPPRAEVFQMVVEGPGAFGAPVRGNTAGPCGAISSRHGNRLVALRQKLKGSHPALDVGGHSVRGVPCI